MRTVYATQFKVLPKVGEKATDVISAVVEEIVEWAKARYKRQGIDLNLLPDGNTVSPVPGEATKLTIESAEASALVTFAWTYPSQHDPTLLWETDATVAIVGDEIEVAIVLRLSSTGFAVKPIGFDLGNPKIVAELVRKFTCMIAQIELRANPTILTSENVGKFVENHLRNDSRSIPVVLVSPEVWTDKYLIDPGALQSRLVGLAHVAQLDSKWAAFSLTDAVGKLDSCYDGAVRVYWPSAKAAQSSLQGHLYLPSQIEKFATIGRPLDQYLFRQFAAFAAFRYIEAGAIRLARSSVDDARRKRIELLHHKAQTSEKGSQDEKEFLDLALAENNRLTQENVEYRNQIDELKRDLATTRLNFDAITRADVAELADDLAPALASPDEEQLSSVHAALELIAVRNADMIVVYKSGWDAAKDSDFSRPIDVFKGLLALVDVGREFFKTKGNQSMGPWEKIFISRGLKYASTESQNTLNMYGKDREFSHEGVKRQMVKHLTIGKGDTKNCLQIYFEVDERKKTLEIGWCGRHLLYYGKGT